MLPVSGAEMYNRRLKYYSKCSCFCATKPITSGGLGLCDEYLQVAAGIVSFQWGLSSHAPLYQGQSPVGSRQAHDVPQSNNRKISFMTRTPVHMTIIYYLHRFVCVQRILRSILQYVACDNRKIGNIH